MDPAWGKPDQAAFVTPNHAFGLAATPNKTNGRLYTKNVFGDVDVCVNMFVSMTASADDIGGLVFWASDDNNYYFLAITGDGRYAVLRDSGGKWSTPVALTKTNVLVPGKTKANTLQIGLVGNEATITINGQQVGNFQGEPPQSGGYIGLRVAAGARGVTAWGFFNLSVTNPTKPASGSAPAASGPAAPTTLPPPAPAALPTPTSAPPAPTLNTCTGPPVYADNFQSFDASAWGPIDNMSLTVNSAQGAALILAANGGGANIRFNTRSFAPNINVCVSLSLAANGNTVNGGGLIFWASDNKNYYALMITGAGTFSVLQQSNGQWTMPVAWTTSSALKSGVNVYNELQVNLAGNNASIIINGEQITNVTGQPPATGNYLGLISEAGPNKGVAWMFAQFDVTSPTASEPPAQAPPAPPVAAPSIPPLTLAPAPCPGKVVYADDFKSLDTSAWGPADDLSLAADMKLVLQAVGTNNIRLNTKRFDSNIDICVGLSLGADRTANAGGLIFWASDPKNYYALTITNAGMFSVSRQSNGQASTPVAWAKSSALKAGANAVNELRVNLAGTKATIDINGREVASLTQASPSTGNSIGLLSEAEAKLGGAWAFSQLSVTNPALPQVLYSDEFTTMDSAAWGAPDSGAFVSNGALNIVAASGRTNGCLNRKYTYRDVDVLVSLADVNPSGSDESGGLVFWYSDGNNFYYLAIDPRGKFAVLRKSAGVWSASVPWTQTAAVKPGAGAFNAVQVNLAENQASVLLNGQQATSFTGQAPPNGGAIGFFVAASTTAATTWAFQHLAVTAPMPMPPGSGADSASTPPAAAAPSVPASMQPTPASAPRGGGL